MTWGAPGARHRYRRHGKSTTPRVEELIGIDNSEAMLEQASSALNSQERARDQRVRACRAISWMQSLDNASVVILNYTLQFIPIEQRETLLKRIRERHACRVMF